MKRVFIVGHRGMLGHVVARYLTENGADVLTSESKYAGKINDPLLNAIVSSQADWIINAAVKTSKNASNRRDLFLVNAQLPIHLKSILTPSQKLIHASTDGVFTGSRGNYSVDDSPDAEDDYGISKSLAEIVAEVNKAFVIRCSIIGPDPNNNRGLFEWLLKQTAEVQGFNNHRWNGITTLEWAKICFELIDGSSRNLPALLQPTSTAVCKFELLKMIAAEYSISTEIIAKPGPDNVDRTLISNWPRASLGQQLKELHFWHSPDQAV